MVPAPVPPEPARRPPPGVPRWLWPPPGAAVRRLEILEHALAGEAQGRFLVAGGEPPEPLHLRALQWLLHDHPCGERPAGLPFEGRVRLEIARTELPGGRVGHAYALDGGPLGAPEALQARGLLLRYARAALHP